MARIDNLDNFLEDVGNAIKEVKGSNEPILIVDYDTEIKNLPDFKISEEANEKGTTLIITSSK